MVAGISKVKREMAVPVNQDQAKKDLLEINRKLIYYEFTRIDNLTLDEKDKLLSDLWDKKRDLIAKIK